MVKEAEVAGFVPSVTAKQYFDLIYSTEKAGKAFQAKVNNDPNARYSPWVEGTRKAEFALPVNVPAMMKKLVGMDVIPVEETQRLAWKDAHTFSVTSEPQLNFPGASKFTTGGCITVSQSPAGCQLLCVMSCTAALGWPLQSSVEAVMVTEAVMSITKFIEWSKEYCAMHAQVTAAAAAEFGLAGAASAARSTTAEVSVAATAAGVADSAQQAEEAAAGEETFYDASEQQLVPFSAQDVLLRCLQRIQAASEDSATSLHALVESMSSMCGDIHAVRMVVAPARASSSGVGSKGVKLSTSSRSSSYLGYALTFGLGLSVGMVVCMRLRHTSLGSRYL